MKIFENKSIFKKIVIVLLIVLIASFCFSGKVHAAKEKGGKLLNPIIDLLVFMGDGCMNIIHKVIYGYGDSTITIDLMSDTAETIWTWIAGVVGAIVVVAAVVLTAGAVAAVAAGIGITLSSISVGTVLMVAVAGGVVAASVVNSNFLPDEIELPVYMISPEAIFSNDIGLFDVNFFTPKPRKPAMDSEGNTLKDEYGNDIYWESTAEQLRETISNWYNVLRDIAVVALLSILVYVGIRIVISSTSNDKAKYKQMLMDWIVAICLLFVMQYIMSFSNILVGKVTDVMKTLKYDNGYFQLLQDEDGKIEERLSKLDYDVSDLKTTEAGANYIKWKTNLLGYARMNAQWAKEESASYAGYGIIFLVLVLFTIYFIFTYLRRVLYMAFLTIIAPFVAMTYPIDKMTDGKAQAFNMWFKEYIFNLLIQPMHLILYTVLVTSAFELASKNIIYSIVAIGFMIPAEKLLRKFFGFEKAQTPGLLAGPAGAAMTMAAMNKVLSKGPKGGGKLGDSKSASKEGGANQKPPRINTSFNKQDAMLGSSDENYKKDNNRDKANPNNDTELEEPQINDTEQNSRQGQFDGQDNFINEPENIDMQHNIGDESENIDMQDGFEEESQNTNMPHNFEPENIDMQDNVEDEYDDQEIDFQQFLDNQNEMDSQEMGQSKETGNRTTKEPKSLKVDNKAKKNNTKISKPSRLRKMGSAFVGTFRANGKAARQYYSRGLREKLENKINNAHPLQTATKVIGGAAVGAIAGGIGLAAGITTGDVSKAAQYAGGAALGGYKVGSGGVSSASRAMHVDGMEEVQERAKYKTEEKYKEAKQQEYVENYQNDKDNRFRLEKKYGKKDANDIMKNVVPECLDKGISNIDDIIAINEMVRSNPKVDLPMAISTAKYASRVGKKPKDMTKRDRERWEETFRQEFGNNKRVKEKNLDTEKITTDVMDRINMYYDIKSQL